MLAINLTDAILLLEKSAREVRDLEGIAPRDFPTHTPFAAIFMSLTSTYAKLR